MAADFLFKESHDTATPGLIWGKETDFLTLLKLQVLASVDTGGMFQRQPIICRIR